MKTEINNQKTGSGGERPGPQQKRGFFGALWHGGTNLVCRAGQGILLLFACGAALVAIAAAAIVAFFSASFDMLAQLTSLHCKSAKYWCEATVAELVDFISRLFGCPHCEPPHCGCPPHCGNPPHCGCPPCEPSGCSYFLLYLWTMLTFPLVWLTGRKIEASRKQLNPEAKMKVAYVSVFGTPCGIATYNEELLTEVREHVDVRVFAEYADDSRAERMERDPEWVTRCWSRNEHPKTALIRAIQEYQPDIVHIGHEYGFFSRAYLFTSLVTWLKAKGFPVVVTLHSIYEHKDKVVTEASAPNIIVHTEAGRKCLIKKGIDPDKISIIPHGTEVMAGTPDAPELLNSLWNTWHTPHTIFHPGFLFGYKGHLRMLGVVARLKEVYPDVHYIIQGSENPLNSKEHDELHDRIMTEARNLGIESNVTVNRGFVSKEVLLSFIRTTRCCVLPYVSHPDHEVRATSGIARVVAGTETPLVTSTAHLFDDVDGVATKCGTDDELYEAVDAIFRTDAVRKSQLAARVKFLKDTSWKKVGQKTADLYKKLAAR